MSSPQSQTRPGGSTLAPGAPASLSRWLWTWIIIAILVVIVVIGFLLGIVGALVSIDNNLGVTTDAVTGVGGDVRTLPRQIQDVNESLGNIDTAVKPVAGQADQIAAGLTSIRNSLQGIDGSLKSTSGSLADTSGSLVGTAGTVGGISTALVTTAGATGNIATSLATISASLRDTSSVLNQVEDRAGAIRVVLEDTQSPRDDLGTEDIIRRVAITNDILKGVLADTGDILKELKSVNDHLNSICEALLIPGECGQRGRK
jgi:prophage DNA circulation protein